MFLARTVAHTTNWRWMLEQMSPRDFKEWQAMYRIAPWAIEPAIEEEKKSSDLSDSLNVARRMAGV